MVQDILTCGPLGNDIRELWLTTTAPYTLSKRITNYLLGIVVF